jgi:very-short-patch-repair endonuclease
VADITNGQHGLVTRVQLYELGLRRGAINHALKRGRIVPRHRGVYALGDLALPPLAPYMAAVLAVGEGAFLSHHSAAFVWGILPERDGEVEVTVVGRDAGRRRKGIRVHRASSLDPRDTSELHHIPIVSAARALLDIAPTESPRGLERAFDGALKARLVTRHAAARMLTRASLGRPGAVALSTLVAAELRASTETKSEAEERFLELVRAGGLPAPELNARIAPYTVDALWRDHKLVVEIDGYAFHSTHRSFESDHERDLRLTAAGFTVMRFTRDQVVKQGAWVLVRLAQCLTSIEAQSGRSSRIVS